MAKEGPTIDDVKGGLSEGKVPPVYLFYGAEDFLVEEATQTVIDALLPPEQRGFNLDVMYGGDADIRDIISHASSFPMMAERRIVVIRDSDKVGNKELLSSYIEHPSPTTCLILQAGKPDLRKKPFSTVRRTGMVVSFDPIRDYQIPAWIGKRVKQQGWSIDAEAVKIIAAYVTTSLREIQSELDKLYTFVGTKRTITSDDVRAVVGMSKEHNVFDLQNAIGQRDLDRSTTVLARMLDAGESPVFLVVMLTRYFQTLWRVYDLKRRGLGSAEVASKLGLNPFFIKDYIASVDRFTLSEVERAFERLVAADEQLKSSSIDPFQIIERAIVLIIQQNLPQGLQE